MTRNSARMTAGGAWGDRWNSCTLHNCIAYFNTAPVGANYFGATLQYSCTTPLPTDGVGNIDADPLLLSLTGGDVRLSPGSPCIDTGTNLSAFMRTDLFGIPRPLDGNGDGVAAFDMGAYEFLLPTADSNGDGIPDGWCVRYSLNPIDPAVAAGNPDQDGRSTCDEWLADTDPTNPESYFHLIAIASGPPMTISFQSSSNRLYTLCSTSNLAGAVWSDMPGQTGRPGSGGIDTLTDTNTTAQRFYRVRVGVP